MPKPKLLLHTCCAPCSAHIVKELSKDYDVSMYFYNPNIHPLGEFFQRLDSAQKLSSELDIRIIKKEFYPEEWLEEIKGFEDEPEGGNRCKLCVMMRLKQTARYAKENKFDFFTTTLSVSPHKDTTLINSLGKMFSQEFCVGFLEGDFKKNNGFANSVRASKELKLYRQKYCGCFYSMSLTPPWRKYLKSIQKSQSDFVKQSLSYADFFVMLDAQR